MSQGELFICNTDLAWLSHTASVASFSSFSVTLATSLALQRRSWTLLATSPAIIASLASGVQVSLSCWWLCYLDPNMATVHFPFPALWSVTFTGHSQMYYGTQQGKHRGSNLQAWGTFKHHDVWPCYRHLQQSRLCVPSSLLTTSVTRLATGRSTRRRRRARILYSELLLLSLAWHFPLNCLFTIANERVAVRGSWLSSAIVNTFACRWQEIGKWISVPTDFTLCLSSQSSSCFSFLSVRVLCIVTRWCFSLYFDKLHLQKYCACYL